MSVESFGEQRTPVCDGWDGECPARLAGELRFEEAVAAMRRAGWTVRKSAKTKKWVHMCPECTEAEKRESEASEEQKHREQRLRSAAAGAEYAKMQ